MTGYFFIPELNAFCLLEVTLHGVSAYILVIRNISLQMHSSV